jgi:RNA polymerase subunit RPABC4/transcription elongation factor Spt4
MMLESFFFFIGGIQPKVKVLEDRPQRCPRCGLHQAYLTRVDHYLSFFFIPLLKVRTGEPLLICRRCERPAQDPGSGWTADRSTQPTTQSCRYCGRGFPADYLFCPICGRRL